MGSQERPEPTQPIMELGVGPRISFSDDLTPDGSNFIFRECGMVRTKMQDAESDRLSDADFEFLSGNSSVTMSTADELFVGGRIAPFQLAPQMERVDIIDFKPEEEKKTNGERPSESWFVNDDPSPRLPTCTVLWKELLRLRKHPPSSSSPDDEKRRIKGLERTRSGSVRLRPMVHVPPCTQGKNNANAMPLLVALKTSTK